jgi:hypothetical protein
MGWLSNSLASLFQDKTQLNQYIFLSAIVCIIFVVVAWWWQEDGERLARRTLVQANVSALIFWWAGALALLLIPILIFTSGFSLRYLYTSMAGAVLLVFLVRVAAIQSLGDSNIRIVVKQPRQTKEPGIKTWLLPFVERVLGQRFGQGGAQEVAGQNAFSRPRASNFQGNPYRRLVVVQRDALPGYKACPPWLSGSAQTRLARVQLGPRRSPRMVVRVNFPLVLAGSHLSAQQAPHTAGEGTPPPVFSDVELDAASSTAKHVYNGTTAQHVLNGVRLPPSAGAASDVADEVASSKSLRQELRRNHIVPRRALPIEPSETLDLPFERIYYLGLAHARRRHRRVLIAAVPCNTTLPAEEIGEYLEEEIDLLFPTLHNRLQALQEPDQGQTAVFVVWSIAPNPSQVMLRPQGRPAEGPSQGWHTRLPGNGHLPNTNGFRHAPPTRHPQGAEPNPGEFDGDELDQR